MPKLRLSEKFLTTSLTCPDGKRRIEFCDTAVPGLYVEVRNTSPDQGTFYLRYKDSSGKTCHAKIGRTIDIDLATAREKAKERRAEITLGADPAAEKKARKAILTFTTFFEDHYLPVARQTKRTWKRDQELFNLRLKDKFGRKKLSQITRAEIQTFHTRLRGKGLAGATCDHYVKLLRRCLNLAVEWDLLNQNPAANFRLFNEPNQVEHFLDEDELSRLLEVLRKDQNQTVAQLVLWSLATGARLSESLGARWDHIDRARRIWRIPASNSKSKRVRAIPLNAAAVGVLDALDTEDEFEWLFVNRRRKQPYRNVAKAFDRIRRAADLPHLRFHDMRHGFASHLVSAGKSLYQVQQLLGHSDPKTTMRYSHLSPAALQDAADAASDALTRASKPTETATE
jgi:integrase